MKRFILKRPNGDGDFEPGSLGISHADGKGVGIGFGSPAPGRELIAGAVGNPDISINTPLGADIDTEQGLPVISKGLTGRQKTTVQAQ